MLLLIMSFTTSSSEFSAIFKALIIAFFARFILPVKQSQYEIIQLYVYETQWLRPDIIDLQHRIMIPCELRSLPSSPHKKREKDEFRVQAAVRTGIVSLTPCFQLKFSYTRSYSPSSSKIRPKLAKTNALKELSVSSANLIDFKASASASS